MISTEEGLKIESESTSTSRMRASWYWRRVPSVGPSVERRARWRCAANAFWPWLVLLIAILPAVWHVVDFPEDVDDEYPGVLRPTFSRRPPPAYRLAEPGDTIDRIVIYTGAGAAVFALLSLMVSLPGERDARLAAFGLGLAALWHGATPWPTFDGWHGLGFHVAFDPTAPLGVRAAVACLEVVLGGLIIVPTIRLLRNPRAAIAAARREQVFGLLVAAGLLAVARQFEIPGVEPVGYWPRCFLVWSLVALNCVLVRTWPAGRRSRPASKIAIYLLGIGLWLGLVVCGVWMARYHRPLHRLHTVVPGKIYISAMPTAWGLETANARHHFKTVINVFPEDTPQRSPLLDEELRFVREHHIKYYGSPSDPTKADAFLDQTLQIAQDPNAWPILVHCHGCMDRWPAWMGIYRSVVEGRPLLEILQEIERHRGYRPKAGVTVLYNRVLPPRAGARYEADPTGQVLRWAQSGVTGPPPEDRPARANRSRLSGDHARGRDVPK